MPSRGTPFPLEVNPRLPAELARLDELANNLWFSWNRPARALFARLDSRLWEAVDHSPKALLQGVGQKRLEEAARDPVFLHELDRTLATYDAYHGRPPTREGPNALGTDELVAYFCAEFGFHESLPIYSGGLGILAGDHCKTASDMALSFVAVGLLYRQGYFQQTIDAEGTQHAHYSDNDFGDLPITPVLDGAGKPLEVKVEFGEHDVFCKIWKARVGRIVLYLLDTDHEHNRPEDRATAHRLYGGDRNTRIQQEIVLGMGGARALQALGIKPTAWHINEGHAAFLVLERMRALVAEGLDLDTALETVAANTIFTTHTAVAAGHDHFAPEKMERYFFRYCKELGINKEALMALGRTPKSSDFNMTALAARGSRFMNGVSRIHGDVSALILGDLWPEVPEEENPISYVTNGVHAPSFLAPEMADAFERYIGSGWNSRLEQPGALDGVKAVPDHLFWSIRQHLKSRMFELVRQRVRAQHFRNHGSEAHLDRLLKYADPANPKVLTIGFARRFATYKRATLLFSDLDWLRQIISDADRPVLFLFAGKAHPADEPGKEFVRRITQVAAMPEFEGRFLLVEGYDLRLARRLVSGVDVWLNNPIFPLEASGTSGMKAGFNGVINLSVLDGWWGEGYTGDNGWAIKPASEKLSDERRNVEEGRSLYELLQDKVIPLYYDRGDLGFSPEWIQMAKRSIMTLLPQFNSERMVGEYLARFYVPACARGKQFSGNHFAVARDVAGWKRRVRPAWPQVQVRAVALPERNAMFGDKVRFSVGMRSEQLTPDDMVVELLLVPAVSALAAGREPDAYPFTYTGERGEGGEYRFQLDLAPELCGKLDCSIRAYPYHPALSHRFEMGLMKWV
ncbi:MAG: alpha-glucan family phosphorylase [Pseudomonadota bacterium]|nr:alpha-glucan family phosphorylase [Pseudomonadota bacterium]